MINGKNVAAVILAAGSGTRMQTACKKQMLDINGKTVLQHAVNVFNEMDEIDSIVVVTRKNDIARTTEDMSEFDKVVSVVAGGETRIESAEIGFNAIPEISEYVAIHDAVRCVVSSDIIKAVLNVAIEFGAATAGTRVYDTVKQIDGSGNIVCTLDRRCLFAAHTPQIFNCNLYKRALKQDFDRSNLTDDNSLLEQIGIKVKAVDTGAGNVKITTKEDLEYVKFLLRKKNGVSV